jgi:predicted nucleic acid-binding protein
MPTLVLCDTNVLLAHLAEDGAGGALDEMRRPGAAERFRAMRADDRVRLAVTRTVARELRAVVRSRAAIQEDEEDAASVRALLPKADALVEALDVKRVADVVPRPAAEDVARVRAFYEGFRVRLRGITARKAGRAAGRGREVVRRRTRGRPGSPGLPERADLRLLAEAAWIAEGPVAGVGGVGIASDDADFRAFSSEIERAFGVGVR